MSSVAEETANLKKACLRMEALLRKVYFWGNSDNFAALGITREVIDEAILEAVDARGILTVCERQEAMRPEVQVFAHAMEDTLQKNDAEKGACGWSEESYGYLLRRMDEETRELSVAVKNLSSRDIRAEAVDVANFAMMIYDLASRRIAAEDREVV